MARLAGTDPNDLKADYLKALISAGFKHIDAASFVSQKPYRKWPIQEDVLKELDLPDDVEIIAIVVNEKGARRAIETEKVRTLGFPYSVSPTFLHNNQRQTPEESLEQLEEIQKKADDAGLERGGLYLDGVRQSLRRRLRRRRGGRSSRCTGVERHHRWFLSRHRRIWHLRSRFARWFRQSPTIGYLKLEYTCIAAAISSEKIIAAYDAGCRRFDSALGGLGGCPPRRTCSWGIFLTEVCSTLSKSAAPNLPPLKSLDALLRASIEIGGEIHGFTCGGLTCSIRNRGFPTLGSRPWLALGEVNVALRITSADIKDKRPANVSHSHFCQAGQKRGVPATRGCPLSPPCACHGLQRLDLHREMRRPSISSTVNWRPS